uniref:Uncharacterized protein n=1 Tax=Steinernema glaseri TaxID=37863 RepID=A0A1I7YIF2_9BILA
MYRNTEARIMGQNHEPESWAKTVEDCGKELVLSANRYTMEPPCKDPHFAYQKLHQQHNLTRSEQVENDATGDIMINLTFNMPP